VCKVATPDGGGSWVQLQLHGLKTCGWLCYGGIRTVEKRARGRHTHVVQKHREMLGGGWVVHGVEGSCRPDMATG